MNDTMKKCQKHKTTTFRTGSLARILPNGLKSDLESISHATERAIIGELPVVYSPPSSVERRLPFTGTPEDRMLGIGWALGVLGKFLPKVICPGKYAQAVCLWSFRTYAFAAKQSYFTHGHFRDGSHIK